MEHNHFPAVALGAWAWGNDGTFGDQHTEESLRPIFEAAMKHGLNLWDTAFVYGMGTSEKMLGSFLKGLPRDSYYISDKFTPQCADEQSETPIADMLKTEYSHLGVNRMDLYWIHNPVGAPHWTTELAKHFEGKPNVPLLGVSNHNLAEIKEAAAILEAHGLKLSAVQNHFSLLYRSSERAGILDYCKEHGITFYAYMVLEQGALSGRYDTAHPLPAGSMRAATYNPILPQLEALTALMARIGAAHDASVAQVATAWAIGKGTVPIIGVTRPSHVEDAARAAQICLSDAEMAQLEMAAAQAGVDTRGAWEHPMD